MTGSERARISVICAWPERQVIVTVDATPEMSVAEAVERSGLGLRFPEIAQRPLSCAIYGQPASLTRKVRAGDRIEILRPLLIDPRERRRQAAARASSQPQSCSTNQEEDTAGGRSMRATLSASSKNTMK